MRSTAQNGQGSVENRESQYKQRRGQRREYRAFLRIDNRHVANQESKKVSATVTHVNSRGRKVEP